MRRWLWVLPWAVAVSTYPGNCTYVTDNSSDTYGSQTCETKTSHAITYKDQALICCGDTDSSCMFHEPCDWMPDVTAAFNEMAVAREARQKNPEPEEEPSPDGETEK